jgi:hypothetical protein
MLSNELKPHTKEDFVRLQHLLVTTKTIEDARSALPVSLVSYIESEMKKTNNNFDTVIKDIKISLNNMKYIKLYLPFEPTKRLQEKMIVAFDIPHTDRYVEVIKDESFVGGAKIVIDGKLYDHTIDKLIYEKCV